MELAGRGDTSDPLAGFVKALTEKAANMFANENKVLGIFELAEKTLWRNRAARLSSLCSYSEDSSCWAVQCQSDWNHLLNRRGVELVQLHRGTLHFRTLDTVRPGDLHQEEDAVFICIYLWLLGQHRCISSVVLNLRVLAPNHEDLFCSLLKLPASIKRCHIIVNSTADSHISITALEELRFLTELTIGAVHLSHDGSEALADLVRRNTNLRILIISDVHMAACECAELLRNVIAHENLEDFRLKMALDEERSFLLDKLALFGASLVKKLHLHLDNEASTALLLGMLGSSALVELTLEVPLDDQEVISTLADFVQCDEALRRLKFKIDVRNFDCTRTVAHDLHRIVGRSQLRTLILSGSTLSTKILQALASGLTFTHTLRQLYLDNCNLCCNDALCFFRVTMENAVLEELVLGVLEGTEEEQSFFFKCLVYADLTRKVTCVFSESQMQMFMNYAQTLIRRKISKVSLRYLQSTDAEPLLHQLCYRMESLMSLTMKTPQPLSSLGGQFLARTLRNHYDLKILGLHCPTTQNCAIQILKGLGKTKSVAVLSLQNWTLNETVQRHFVDMLQQNTSIQRLDLYFEKANDYGAFRESLKKGLEGNRSVTAVNIYCGIERDEVFDPEILQRLQRAQMAISWAVDEILKNGRCPEAAAAVDRLKQCDSTLDMLEYTTEYSHRTAARRVRDARLETWPLLDALTSAFGDRPDFKLSAEGRVNFEQLLDQAYGDIGVAHVE